MKNLLPPKNKKALAEFLRTKSQNAKHGGLGRYALSSAFHRIAAVQRFIAESLAAEEKQKSWIWSVSETLSEHLPIMVVAAMESFFRDSVAELIDHGEPFAARAADLIESSQSKLDYPIFLAVQKKTFTIGEFISHIVPLNSLETISATLSTLLGKDFRQLLRAEELTSKLWDSKLSILRIGDDPGPIFSAVERIVEIRNSIAHEVRQRPTPAAINEIIDCCDRAQIFLIGAETHLFRLLHPNEPEFPSEVELKEFAFQRLRKAEDTMDQLFGEYRNLLSRLADNYEYQALHDRVSELDDFQKRWREFVKLKATIAANEYAGGTIRGLIYTRDLEASTLARLQELREAIKRMK